MIYTKKVTGIVDDNKIHSEDENVGGGSGDLDVSANRRALQEDSISTRDRREVRRPITKKQRGFKRVEALDRLTQSNKHCTSKIKMEIIDTRNGGAQNGTSSDLTKKVEKIKSRSGFVEEDAKEIINDRNRIFYF